MGDPLSKEVYVADSSMRESQSAPRVGRDAHVANERHVFGANRDVRTNAIPPIRVYLE